ncbi:hypothetical protein BC831DRAFT_516668 [Entophlyctis helioformis]|nr:hypothetical protein BC831DRAFT_516668 [Entophlyctis helioformis]
MYAPNPQASSIQQTYQPLATVYQQSYANTVAIPESDSVCYEGMMTAIGNFFGFFGSIPPFRMVQQGSVGLVSRFGKYYRSVDPGLIFVNICSESIVTLEIKIQIEDVPRQQVMTKDNVSIFIDSVLYWHVVDPYVATFLVQDVRKALVERTMTTLRHVFGTRTLQDCIENRNTIAHEIHAVIGPAAQAWGVKIENILIKDLQFSQELQETLSSAAKQKRIGESK